MPEVFHFADREIALDMLTALYQGIELHFGPAGTGDCAACCVDQTPVCSHTEAEYVREHLDQVPYADFQKLSRRARGWLLQDDQGPHTRLAFGQDTQKLETVRRHIQHLKQQRCPFLEDSGACVLASHGLQPLACRVATLPGDASEPIFQVMRDIFRTYPQRSGFLPTQLMALLHAEELQRFVAEGLVADAKTATGTLRPLMQALAPI